MAAEVGPRLVTLLTLPDPTKISLGLRVPWRDTPDHRRESRLGLRETPTSSGNHSGPWLTTRQKPETRRPRSPLALAPRSRPAPRGLRASFRLHELSPDGIKALQGRLLDEGVRRLGARGLLGLPGGKTNAPR